MRQDRQSPQRTNTQEKFHDRESLPTRDRVVKQSEFSEGDGGNNRVDLLSYSLLRCGLAPSRPDYEIEPSTNISVRPRGIANKKC